MTIYWKTLVDKLGPLPSRKLILFSQQPPFAIISRVRLHAYTHSIILGRAIFFWLEFEQASVHIAINTVLFQPLPNSHLSTHDLHFRVKNAKHITYISLSLLCCSFTS